MRALLDQLVSAAEQGVGASREDLVRILNSSDAEVLDVVAAAGRVRRQFFENRVKLNYLVNMKSGLCPEDCTYCSQRLGSEADILKYNLASTDEVLRMAGAGIEAGARRVCLVSSGRGPSNREVAAVSGTISALKEEYPEVEVCACLGLLKDGQAEQLREAGADAYNHNLNTAESRYEDICTTHTFDDRVDTVNQAHKAGLSACSGLIAGAGETPEELVDVVLALKDLGSDSIPVNFLVPFEGTPLSESWNLTPQHCLRILAMVRFACPSSEIRASAGREIHLRSFQPMALQIANSIFLGDYLTSEGQSAMQDLEMIRDLGMVIEGRESAPGEYLDHLVQVRAEATVAPPAATGCGTGSGCGGCGVATACSTDVDAHESAPVGKDAVAIRRRGIGTEQAPNAVVAP